MDINLLTLNVGNSRLALGVFQAGALVHTVRIPHDHRADWPGKIKDAWSRIAGNENPAIPGGTTTPDPPHHAVAQATNQKIDWIGKEIDLPIKVATDQPSETGIDRILNIAAA